MSRTVKEWIGKTDDSRAPPRVRDRVFLKHGGICHISKRKIRAGEKWELEHIIAIANGGENREANLAPALIAPHKEKTKRDMAEKKVITRKRKKHLGIKGNGRGFRRPAGAKFNWATGRYERDAT